MASHRSTTLIKTPVPALAAVIAMCLVFTASAAAIDEQDSTATLSRAEQRAQKQIDKEQQRLDNIHRKIEKKAEQISEKQNQALSANQVKKLEKLQAQLTRYLEKQQNVCERLAALKMLDLPDYCSIAPSQETDTDTAVTTTATASPDTESLSDTTLLRSLSADSQSLGTSPVAMSTTSQSVYVPQLLTALQSGPISDPNTFGVLPQNGDRLDAGSNTVTIDQNFTAGQLTDAQDSVALTGEFIVNANIALVVNGDWDASNPNTQNVLKTGASVEFDGDTGMTRVYKAASQYYGYPSLKIEATPDNKAFFGLKPGSAASFKYDKHVYLGSNISGGNVHLNGFSTGYIHDGYDRVATRDCDMPNTLFTNSGQFELRYYAGDNGSCDLSNLTILSPTGANALFTIGLSGSSTQNSTFNLNGLSVDGNVAYYTRPEFLMNDWVVRELSMTLPANAYPDISNWLLFDASTLPVGAASMSGIYYRNERSNPHGFSLAGGSLSSRTLDSVIFDFINLDPAESGDNYLFDGAGSANEVITIRNNISLQNLNGNQSSTFVTFNSSLQNGRQVQLENNVVFIPRINRAISLNEAGETPANILTRVSDNIFWGESGQEGYVADSLTASSATDIISSGAYISNAIFNARTDGTFAELDMPLSYTPATQATGDAPRFHDDQRRLATYGSSVLGLDGTDETAYYAFVTRHLSSADITRLNQLAGHSQYTASYQGVIQVSDLIDWVKQGFIPTTTTYHTTSSTGGMVGLTDTPAFTLADSDSDTVDDQFDLCSGTPTGEAIDDNGCSDTQKDDDVDTVNNATDICIETASGAAVNAQGCSDDELAGQILGFSSWGIGGGGAMAGYSINPFNDQMRFIGTDMGTLFRSLNGGTNWAPVRHSETTFSNLLGYVVNIGFAGPKTILHAPQGLNPVRSTDGGETFSAPASFDLVYSNDGDASNDERITGWYTDTQNVETVYAMTNLGLWRSTDAGANWTQVYSGSAMKGMFIDNHDGGRLYAATATEILTSTNGTSFSSYFTPANHQIHRFSGGSNSSYRTLAYVSDESATAISASIQDGLQNGDVTATYTLPSGAGTEPGAGMVYVNVNNTGFVQSSQYAGSHLLMAQNDPDTLYTTGSRGWGRDKGTSVFVSQDAGSTWSLQFLQYDWDTNPFSPWDSTLLEHSPVALNVGWYDAGYYTVGINQLNSQQFGGSGNFFAHATEDGGTHWKDLTNEYQGVSPNAPAGNDPWSTGGLNVTSVYDIKFHPANNSDIYAAYADIHGVRSTDHGATWQILPNDQNSIYDFAFDPADANTVFMVNGSQHDFPFRDLSLVGAGGVYKSTNKGSNWQRLTPNNADYNRQYLSIGYDASRDHIYAGSHSDGISRSLDGGVTWEKFNTGLPAVKPGTSYAMDLVIPQIEVLANGNVYALVTGVRPELTAAEVTQLNIPQNELITDTSSGTPQYYSWINNAYTGIYLLDVANGATSWQLLRGNIDLSSHGNWNVNHQPWNRPMAFAIDPNNSNTLWLTDMEPRTVQPGATGIWKSTNGGQNWSFVQQHTFGLDINVAPDDSNYVVVAGPEGWGNGGMWVTKDGGQTWAADDRAPLQNNAHSVCFDPADNSKIVYGYFGGGMLYGDRF
ncbi:MAG: hypothetical protein CMI09_12265 [Oceanospirillaceae bacterium]|nr:hypothetical protein [Oceanospirillaceae bacterium]